MTEIAIASQILGREKGETKKSPIELTVDCVHDLIGEASLSKRRGDVRTSSRGKRRSL